MTSRWGSRESIVMSSSVIPSLKYSWLVSPLKFAKGNTAREGMSDGGTGCIADRITTEVREDLNEPRCTSTIVVTMVASPANDNAAPRQYRFELSCASPCDGVALSARAGQTLD